jgi:hypothetical protein
MFSFFRAIKTAWKARREEEAKQKWLKNQDKIEKSLAEHFAKSLAMTQANIEYEVQERALKLAMTNAIKDKAKKKLAEKEEESARTDTWGKPKTN